MLLSSDKKLELDRYDKRAADLIDQGAENIVNSSLDGIPADLQIPYKYFEASVHKIKANEEIRALEIGAGTGALTGILLEHGLHVTATDISEKSLHVLYQRLSDKGVLEIKVADMEFLPFDDEVFDLVTSAGSLSYGDNQLVMREVYRVLKPEGHFLCVDSLNHNIIYRLNRWIRYILKDRTKSTLSRMPTLSLIDDYDNLFGECEVRFFGSLVWLAPILRKILGRNKTGRLMEFLDQVIGVKKSAFKFVMVCKKIEKI